MTPVMPLLTSRLPFDEVRRLVAATPESRSNLNDQTLVCLLADFETLNRDIKARSSHYCWLRDCVSECNPLDSVGKFDVRKCDIRRHPRSGATYVALLVQTRSHSPHALSLTCHTREASNTPRGHSSKHFRNGRQLFHMQSSKSHKRGSEKYVLGNGIILRYYRERGQGQ